MRTNIKAKYGPPKAGEKRTVEKFAFIPTKIITFDGESQNKKLINYYWLWLEKYKEEQVYTNKIKRNKMKYFWQTLRKFK